MNTVGESISTSPETNKNTQINYFSDKLLEIALKMVGSA